MGNESFSVRTAIFLAAVCGQTYLQYINKDGLYLAPSGYKSAGVIHANAYQGRKERFGFVLESKDTIIVAFRGTSSAVEWISDLIAQQTVYKPIKQGGQTHKGFTDIYMSARNELLSALGRLSPRKRLYVTGHSLGGALAVLAAPDIAVNTAHKRPHVYTFAAPRAGDPKFVRMFNAKVPVCWRIYNEHDIVPHLPPLIYRSPKNEEYYFYLHVKGEHKLSFKGGSVPGNHLMNGHFEVLAGKDPQYAAQMCSDPPSWCPMEI
ncbi:Mbeg1-like protein [Paenibacillus tarimensis]